METKVLKIDGANPDKKIIAEAAAVIDAGGLVAFPTETVYGIACKVGKVSFARLDEVKGRGEGKRYTLHVGNKNTIKKYVPKIDLRTSKMIENCLPGPLTIVFEVSDGDVKKQKKKIGEAAEFLYQDNTIGIRCPDNEISKALLNAAKSSVVAPSANISGAEPAVDAAEVLKQLDGKIDLVLDGGKCELKQSSTVVRIGKGGWEILREGAVKRADLEKLSKINVVLVCTGNTCRSPMAEGIFAKRLAEKLGCEVDRLDDLGYKIGSAGVMAIEGFDASGEAAAVCSELGIDISGHKSRFLSAEMVEEADVVFVMCRGHREQIIFKWPEVAGKCLLLAEGKDVSDPIGGSIKIYEKCAALIDKAIIKRISELWI